MNLKVVPIDRSQCLGPLSISDFTKAYLEVIKTRNYNSFEEAKKDIEITDDSGIYDIQVTRRKNSSTNKEEISIREVKHTENLAYDKTILKGFEFRKIANLEAIE